MTASSHHVAPTPVAGECCRLVPLNFPARSCTSFPKAPTHKTCNPVQTSLQLAHWKPFRRQWLPHLDAPLLPTTRGKPRQAPASPGSS
eukprot:COSAG06_NODE_19571_length_832_cov_1.121419_1_plen_87_part_10